MKINILITICTISLCGAIHFNCSDVEKVNSYVERWKANSSVLFSEYAFITTHENVSGILEQDSESSNDTTLTINDVLPPNKLSYLKRRPPSFCGHPAKATYHLTVLSLDSVNEATMTYSLDVYLTVAWIDHRLRYPNTTRDYLILDPNWLGDLWRPDTVFKNAREVTFHERIVPNHFLWMLPNKGLIYVSKLTLILTCSMDFSRYPHDTQECDLKMESMMYTTKELVFDWDHKNPLSLSTNKGKVETPQFRLVLNTTVNSTVPYDTGSYTSIRAVFHLRRRLGYHLIHTYFPSGLIVVLSWVTFWIKPRDITARVGLGVTSLLTLATLSTQSQASLPPVSYGKAIDLWMTCCALFVFCSIVEFAIINYVLSRFPDDGNEIANANTLGDKMTVFFNRRRIHAMSHNIDRISRAFFPTCFILLNVWYWSRYLQKDEIDGRPVSTEIYDN